MSEPRRRKVSPFQLVVLLACLIALLVWLNLFRQRSELLSSRLRMSTNLRQSGPAMNMYSEAVHRTGSYQGAQYGPPPAAQDKSDLFAKLEAYPNDVNSRLFLVNSTKQITTDIFICPIRLVREPTCVPSNMAVWSVRSFDLAGERWFQSLHP